MTTNTAVFECHNEMTVKIVAASGSYPNNRVTAEGTIEPGLPWCPRPLKGGSLYLDLIGYFNKHIKETGDWLWLKNCLTEGKTDHSQRKYN